MTQPTKTRKPPDRISAAKWIASLDDAHQRAVHSLDYDEIEAVLDGLRAVRDRDKLHQRLTNAEHDLDRAKDALSDGDLLIATLNAINDKINRIVRAMGEWP